VSSEAWKQIKKAIREEPALQFTNPDPRTWRASTAPYSRGNPVNSEQFLDETGREYSLEAKSPGYSPKDATNTRLYGGIAARFWLGSLGVSDLIAGIGYFYEPIRVVDQEQVRLEMHNAFVQRIVDAVHQSTGLEISPEDLERVQFLEIWTAEPDLIERCKAFEQGWSALKPAGKGVRDLTGKDIAQLFRRTGAKREARESH
jgi:hypothetical protein